MHEEINSTTLWSDQIPSKDNNNNLSVADIAFSPDGKLIIAAVGNRVLLYKSEDGSLIESLRGHKDTVNSVDFNFDGSRFASGGSDNVVVLWKSSGEGMLKYNHAAPIQKVKFHPLAMKLASCSDIDFGLWSPDQKQVLKEKESSKILSVGWSLDGTIFAIGMQSGVISVRNQQMEELQRFERRGPIRCLLFLPTTFQQGKGSQIQSQQQNSLEGESLVVGAWDKSLSFYLIQQSACKLLYERNLKFYPTSLTLAGNHGKKGNFVLSGSHHKCSLYSKEGLNLFDITTKSSWIWSHSYHTSTNRVVMGTESGGIDMVQVNYGAVHSLYFDKYAYQENLTEVIIQNLISDKKVRIKCKDLIHRISMYKNKLAVQLSDRVCVYESSPDDVLDMHFHLRKERISTTDKTSENMIVTSDHLIFFKALCAELYSFDCIRQRVWVLESRPVCVKSNGGPEGREAIIIGCENGSILKIFVDSPFTMELGKRSNSVTCVDISLNRTKIASVDSMNNLLVTEIKTQQVIYSASNVIFACFNTEIDDMICYYCGDNSIFIVSCSSSASDAKSQQPHELQIPGRPISYQGQKIWCQYRGNLTGIDVPQSFNIMKSINAGDFTNAYKAACLGATENDWRTLAMKSLRASKTDVAKYCFSKLKDIKYLSLIEYIEKGSPVITQLSTGGKLFQDTSSSSTEPNKFSDRHTALDQTWQAEILAYEGFHLEAAKAYTRVGKPDEAIRVLTDLRKYDDAKFFSQSSGYDPSVTTELTTQQAKWLEESNDWKGAAELYLSLGQNFQGAKIAGESQESGWENFLIEIVRRTSTEGEGHETLVYCAQKFDSVNSYDFAKETYEKIGDVTSLMSLYTRRQMWSEAAALAENHSGKFDVSVFLPYADWLVSEDKYEEAIGAYKKAGRKDLGIKILNELLMNCVQENRFKDASYYSWKIFKEYDAVDNDDDEQQAFEWQQRADIYYAYSTIHSFITEPFTSYQTETLFHVSRFIINCLSNLKSVPMGVSEAATLYTLGRQSMELQTYKLARQVYDKLSKLIPPSHKEDEIELNMLLVQAKPVRDDPDLAPVCYRCSSSNPLLNPFTDKFTGDVCTNCGHPFIRSFINFDVLPLVEFVPQTGINEDEAIELIRQSNGTQNDENIQSNDKKSKWNEGKYDNAETLTFSNGNYSDDVGNDIENDLFTKCLNRTLDRQVSLLSL